MSDYVQIAADTPLNEEEKAQLRALTQKADAEINYSDVPELSDAELEKFRPRHLQPVRLESELRQKLKKAS